MSIRLFPTAVALSLAFVFSSTEVLAAQAPSRNGRSMARGVMANQRTGAVENRSVARRLYNSAAGKVTAAVDTNAVGMLSKGHQQPHEHAVLSQSSASVAIELEHLPIDELVSTVSAIKPENALTSVGTVASISSMYTPKVNYQMQHQLTTAALERLTQYLNFMLAAILVCTCCCLSQQRRALREKGSQGEPAETELPASEPADANNEPSETTKSTPEVPEAEAQPPVAPAQPPHEVIQDVTSIAHRKLLLRDTQKSSSRPLAPPDPSDKDYRSHDPPPQDPKIRFKSRHMALLSKLGPTESGTAHERLELWKAGMLGWWESEEEFSSFCRNGSPQARGSVQLEEIHSMYVPPEVPTRIVLQHHVEHEDLYEFAIQFDTAEEAQTWCSDFADWKSQIGHDLTLK